MKEKSLFFWLMLALPMSLLASISDPIADFKTGLTIPEGDKIMKWEADLTGDGKDEIFLCLKSDFDTDVQNHAVPGWSVYIAEVGPSTDYIKSEGIESEPGAIDSILPDIDTDTCYVGQITQLGKRGIVTMRIKNPRSGESTATIYAFTVDGSHLKYTELAQYQIGQTNAVFTQYLAENVRTQVQLQEVVP